MAYLVRIAARAERDLELLYEEINAANSAAAQRWYAGLKRAILRLAVQPNRCSVTPENKKLKHLLYGHKPHLYRVIYRVNEARKQVDVLHIRHGARRKFRPADLV
jgi:plasmid stabilization system protein ParE